MTILKKDIIHTRVISSKFLVCVLTWLIVYHSSLQQVEADDYTHLLYSDGVYRAVGKSGVIVSSSDAVLWQVVSTGISEHLYGIASNGVSYVVVGGNGSILYSVDGAEWQTRSADVQEDLLGVLWSGAFYVALTSSNRFITSVDGLEWDLRESEDPLLAGIEWIEGEISVYEMSNLVIHLPNATTWVMQGSSNPQQLKPLYMDGARMIIKEPPLRMSQATVNTNYSEWLEEEGLSMITGDPLGDYNIDGIQNLIAYAFDISAISSVPRGARDKLPAMKISPDSGQRIMSLTRPQSERGDVRYVVEMSSSLMSDSWQQIAYREPFRLWSGSALVTETINADGGIDVNVVEDSWMDKQSCYVRLRVELLNN